MSELGYSFLDKLLHRFALQYATIAEMSFYLDQSMVHADPDKIVSQRHVFISGLARGGTTALMRQFYATGQYRSLTYRDMPFVLAPNIWCRLSSISKREIQSIERAHGDSILVNADSPESLDEVFWRIFAGDEYLNKAYLKLQNPAEEVIHKYVCYVNAILSSDSTRCARYLSKNNNNVLRLGAIHKAFPNALILIPFRDPLQQAYSLLRQHRHFSELQASNKFILSYMTWLGHHEFGLDHRPFLLGDNTTSIAQTDTLDYWLNLWCNTYSWLENSRHEYSLLICYEDLCTHENNWVRLAALADIPVDHVAGTSLKLSHHPVDVNFDQKLADRASEIYKRLVVLARPRLS